jgi:hypothetical protein
MQLMQVQDFPKLNLVLTNAAILGFVSYGQL